ncbi:o-succinylbenzoate synthase [Leptolyngbya ohadii]|uniref:o-succinylbenzoate synthase n=1 Tax=Leptolyngbya ohadii TaxID=1962290 RepID=UPI0019D48713|nr:o-succinylbenzoate synthase [Leptolyngbya ohadii]
MTAYSTVYSIAWRQYSRSFRYPLQTHHGNWAKRQGILVCLQNASGRVGWGEIAPIPWFGSETIDQAIEFFQSLKGQITLEQIAKIPNELPACQFGLESALEILRSDKADSLMRSNLFYSVLLSYKDFEELEEQTDEWQKSCTRPLNSPQIGDSRTYIERWLGSPQNWGARGAMQDVADSSIPSNRSLRADAFSGSPQSSTPFKLKIGVQEVDREINQIDRLLKVLPQTAKLRLDANGGLSDTETYQWLEWCDTRSQNSYSQIEFLEQPLPPDRFSEMQQLSQQFSTPIALDESVATIAQLQDCYQRGWRGIFVIKPAIAGSPDRLRQFCQDYQPDVVWSSALETGIGRRYIENYLIPSTGLVDRAIGFGVDQWFTDDWGQRDAKSLWQELAAVKL